jgi:hypothetical protein
LRFTDPFIYIEDDEEFDLSKLFDEYYLEKGVSAPSV